MKHYLPLIFGVFLAANLMAQCPESTATINVTTDNYPYEISWSLADLDGNVLHTEELVGQPTNSLVSTDVCIPSGLCVVFHIEDDFGDGINSPGGFEVLLDGNVVIQNIKFSTEYSSSFNCPPGTSCNSPLTIVEGSYQTTFDDHWYYFSPDSSGNYAITTCGLTDCDTKIWIYESCGISVGNEDNQGTLFFGDNFGGCGEQAHVIGTMVAGDDYFIRIGDDNDSCGDTIAWEIYFDGLISGCTDPLACNYNPAATIDDGSCITFGDPACPDAPDLYLDEGIFRSSMYLATIDNSDDCLIQEGCLKGYGLRDIIRFSTHIANIGELDYYIGLETADSGQFTFDNCHNHWHYDGYAEYLFFDESGQEIPIGFKNGFCVLDLGCNSGSAKYSCNNMGISAGCYDEYWAELECQWVDITDIPDGDYTLVTRVNWDNAPDALGRVERDTLNNWAQACINIDRSSGQIAFNQIPDCQPYEDCAGVLYGDSQLDCNGVCGGPSLMGDLDIDLSQSELDLNLYAEGIISADLVPTSCNDLSAEGSLDVYDACLFASCLNYGAGHVHVDNGPHNHCDFPINIIALNDEASLEIINSVPFEYLDVGMTNLDSRVVGYQFSMSGIKINNVENLVDTALYDHMVMMDPLTNMVMSFSRNNDFIERSMTAQPLVRIYYSEIIGNEICIENIVGIINDNLERVPNTIEGACLLISSLNQFNGLKELSVFPNPTSNELTINWKGDQAVLGWELANLHGQVLREGNSVEKRQLKMDLSGLNAGLYFIKLLSSEGHSLIKIVKQ